jgi:hypothetical protein
MEDFIVGEAMDEFVPGLLLTFEGGWYTPDPRLPEALRRISTGHWEPVRAVEVGVVLTAIEEIYLASIRGDLPPKDYRRKQDWAAEADARSLTLRVHSLRMGSPLHVLLDLPATIYVSTFGAFSFGLAHVLGVPYRAAAVFERARERYYEQRLATAEAKDAWLDYKAKRVARQTTLRLRAVEVALPRRERDEEERPIEPPGDS